MNLKKYPCMSILEFSREEMIEVYDSITRFNWHKKLGKKPKWWIKSDRIDSELADRMSEHVEGAVETIENIIGERDLLMYSQINNFGKTKLQFYHYWYVERRLPKWLLDRI